MVIFFIGIFGIGRKQKELNTIHNSICKYCGRYTSFVFYKEYSYFHIFFIPIITYNESYYVRSECCGSIFSVRDEIAQQLKKDPNVKLQDSDLDLMHPGNKGTVTCPNCGTDYDFDYNYCPNCSAKNPYRKV